IGTANHRRNRGAVFRHHRQARRVGDGEGVWLTPPLPGALANLHPTTRRQIESDPGAAAKIPRNTYLGGNRRDDRNLKSSAAIDFGSVITMHQIVSATVDSPRRWWVLAIVIAAQFMFGVDAFIVNVAIPTIAVDLHATPAQIESVIAIYLIAYATLVVTGGRLGDIHGTRNVFLAGVLGFTAPSL